MAFNGSGVFNRVHSWATDLAGAVPVTASRMDAEMDGMATGLSTCVARDGQSTTTARIPFAAGTSAAAGTTSSVSYAQTNDTNTGMYFPATDQWGLVAGGTATLASTATALAAGVNLGPASSDGAALGTTALMWSDLFLASGAVINFNNGDVTATHSANALAFAGGTVTFDTAPTPAASDGAALGTASVMWSDLFLASGSVVNFNNGDVTLTHSANALTVAGGNFVVATLTIGSNVVNGAVPTRQVLTSGTAATYTTPAGCRQLRVKLIGGGGGGGAAATNNGANGTTTVFHDINATGGSGGTAQGGAGGNGGTGGGGTASFRMDGGDGGGGCNGASAATVPAGKGGSGAFGGAGKGATGSTSAGTAGKAGTGGGGGGGVATNSTGGGGGGSGEYAEVIINSPSATYTYTVGAGGAGGAAGTAAGGAGGIGIIIVDEFY